MMKTISLSISILNMYVSLAVLQVLLFAGGAEAAVREVYTVN